jgi:hypothetical protein
MVDHGRRNLKLAHTYIDTHVLYVYAPPTYTHASDDKRHGHGHHSHEPQTTTACHKSQDTRYARHVPATSTIYNMLPATLCCPPHTQHNTKHSSTMLCLHAHNTTCTHASCASDERRDGAIGRTTGARCGDIGRYRCAMIYDLQADDRGAAAAPLRRRLQDV